LLARHFIVTQSQVLQNIKASGSMVHFYSYPAVLRIHWIEQDCSSNPALQLIITGPMQCKHLWSQPCTIMLCTSVMSPFLWSSW
jgi:hypothetical protein